MTSAVAGVERGAEYGPERCAYVECNRPRDHDSEYCGSCKDQQALEAAAAAPTVSEDCGKCGAWMGDSVECANCLRRVYNELFHENLERKAMERSMGPVPPITTASSKDCVLFADANGELKLMPADGVERPYPAGEPIKDTEGKVPVDQMPHAAIRMVRLVNQFGAKKYAKESYRRVPSREWYGAIERHLDAWLAGEKADHESGLHPLAHAACSLLYMLENEIGGKTPAVFGEGE